MHYINSTTVSRHFKTSACSTQFTIGDMYSCIYKESKSVPVSGKNQITKDMFIWSLLLQATWLTNKNKCSIFIQIPYIYLLPICFVKICNVPSTTVFIWLLGVGGEEEIETVEMNWIIIYDSIVKSLCTSRSILADQLCLRCVHFIFVFCFFISMLFIMTYFTD